MSVAGVVVVARRRQKQLLPMRARLRHRLMLAHLRHRRLLLLRNFVQA
jgi:hypothetical protein